MECNSCEFAIERGENRTHCNRCFRKIHVSGECEMDSRDSRLIPSGEAWCTKCLAEQEGKDMEWRDPVATLEAAAKHVSDLTTERLRVATARLVDAALFEMQMGSRDSYRDLSAKVDRYKEVAREPDADFATHLQLSILINIAEGKMAEFVPEGWTLPEIAKALADEHLTGGAA